MKGTLAHLIANLKPTHKPIPKAMPAHTPDNKLDATFNSAASLRAPTQFATTPEAARAELVKEMRDDADRLDEQVAVHRLRREHADGDDKADDARCLRIAADHMERK